ncbi:MAG: hypothetical protein ACOC1P_05860, partial [Minisyncoccales bacterium]
GTKYCFNYNGTIVFCVPKRFLSQALGKNAENLKKISDIIGKRIRIVALPNGVEEAERFFKDIINPIQFKEMEITEDEIIITAGKQNKASLLGREKRRLIDLQKVSKEFFGKDLRVI